jgi:hypothetical protein
MLYTCKGTAHTCFGRCDGGAHRVPVVRPARRWQRGLQGIQVQYVSTRVCHEACLVASRVWNDLMSWLSSWVARAPTMGSAPRVLRG